MKFIVNSEKNNEIMCSLYHGDDLVSCCGLTKKDSEWTISKWNTYYSYQHHGYGKKTMRKLLEHCIDTYGRPSKVSYIWNGQNTYVGEWLKNHFNAKCCCPISVLKNNSDDDWESHIYNLDVGKLLQYFELE